MSVEGRVQKAMEARAGAMGQTKARQRIGLLLDSGSFVEIDGLVRSDGKPTGVVCGYGAVMGSPVAVFAQDSEEENGAVGAAHAAKICKVYDFALKTGIPVVGIYDSRGARLSEGVGALAGYGDMLRCANNLSGVVPQLSLVLGTCAGVSAMLACSSDFLLMSKNAELFLAAPESGEAGTAGQAAASGVAHVVCDDDAGVFGAARKLLTMLPLNNLAPAPISEYGEPGGDLGAICNSMPSAAPADVAAAVCDQGNTVELLSGFGSSVYTAMATMGGFPCGVVSTGGKLGRDDSAKIAKFVSVCDAFQVPVITLLNSEGIDGSGTDVTASIRDMARLAHVYAEATTAKMTVITGPAYGAVYVALAGRAAGSDYTIAWPSAVISALEPKTAVAFLHGDQITKDTPREKVEELYIENNASPLSAAAGGYIDDVIDPALTRPALLSALDLLSAKRVTKNPKKHSNLPL